MPDGIVIKLIERVARLEGKMSVVMAIAGVGTVAAITTLIEVVFKR